LSSCGFQDKSGWREPQSDLYAVFVGQKSYFNGLKINIVPYVKWIKKIFYENLDIKLNEWKGERYRLRWTSSLAVYSPWRTDLG
jgi:hypothetical protein